MGSRVLGQRDREVVLGAAGVDEPVVVGELHPPGGLGEKALTVEFERKGGCSSNGNQQDLKEPAAESRFPALAAWVHWWKRTDGGAFRKLKGFLRRARTSSWALWAPCLA